MRKLTTEEFIEKYEAKFGKKYIWDKFVYKASKEYSTVICPIHGEFEMRPNDLLNGTGCPDCGGTRKYTNEEFKDLARQTHHNFYNVDNIEYDGGAKDIYPICPVHGKFRITAKRLLRGNCCPQCVKEDIKHEITPILYPDRKWSQDTTETFKEKVIKKYGDKYILDKVDYVNNATKVLIGCREHGYFSISPNHFLSGQGCSICAKNRPLTTEEFIKRSKELFPDAFLYDNTKYVSTHEPLIITCKIHGDFYKSPANHFKGQGCPACAQSMLEKDIYDILTSNNIEFVREKVFNTKRKYRYDFYIPSNNILIECQGIQHFESVDIFNKGITLEERLMCDIDKYNIAKNMNYTILYLMYSKRNDLNDDRYKGIYNSNVFYSSKDILNYIKNNG